MEKNRIPWKKLQNNENKKIQIKFTFHQKENRN